MLALLKNRAKKEEVKEPEEGEASKNTTNFVKHLADQQRKIIQEEKERKHSHSMSSSCSSHTSSYMS